MSSGTLVPDATVSSAIIDAIKQSTVSRSGFVLDHFPATPQQAMSLQHAGIVPTKFIFLDLPAAVSEQRLKADPRSSHLSDAQIANSLRSHTEYVNSMVDFYKDLIFYIDATLSPTEIDSRALEYIRTPVFGTDARVPHRILLLGPVGSGKTLHAAKLAAALGVEHVSTSQMLRHAANTDTPEGLAIKKAIAAGQLVPDSVVIPLLRTRLTQYDVQHAGFVMDGCPRTVAQAQLFAQLGMRPSRVAVLEASDDAVEARLLGMRADTVTRQLYSLRGGCASMQPPPNVHHRLAPIAVKPPSFRDAQAEYRKHIGAIKAELGSSVKEFDACAPIADLQAQLLKFIKYPLQH
jgi:adenylate kinase